MHTANLRKVGGSIMLAIPPVLLSLLNLKDKDIVNIDIKDDQIIIRPGKRLNYTLDDLLAQCDEDCIVTDEDREWDDANPVGNELL